MQYFVSKFTKSTVLALVSAIGLYDMLTHQLFGKYNEYAGVGLVILSLECLRALYGSSPFISKPPSSLLAMLRNPGSSAVDKD